MEKLNTDFLGKKLKTLWVSDKEFNKLLGTESVTISRLDTVNLTIGEQVVVKPKVGSKMNVMGFALLRYVVNITPKIAMLADESINDYELSPFNSASL